MFIVLFKGIVISSSDYSFRYSIGILTAFLDYYSRRSFTSYIFHVFILCLSRSKFLSKTSFLTSPIISSAVHLWWVRLTRMPDLFPQLGHPSKHSSQMYRRRPQSIYSSMASYTQRKR